MKTYFISTLLLCSCIQLLQAQWLLCDSNKTTYVIAHGARVYGYQEAKGIIQSPDEGQSWLPPDSTMKKGVSTMALYHDILYAAMGDGLYRTSDFGKTWVERDTKQFEEQTSCLLVDSWGMVAGTHRKGVWRSPDFGITWVRADSGILRSAIYMDYCSILSTSIEIYLGTVGEGVYRSLDSGRSWKSIPSGLEGSAKVMTALTSCAGRVFASTADAVYMLSETDTSWEAASNGITDNLIGCLAAAGSNLFAGTYHSGLFLSKDLGRNWKNITDNIPTNTIRAIAITPQYIFAGTYTSLWRRPLSELIDAQPVLPETPTLAQNYPNPFSHSSTFTFTLPSRMRASLRVYSLLGREIATLAEGEYEAGAHTVSFDASSLPVGGVYVYRLAAGATLLSGRMAFVR